MLIQPLYAADLRQPLDVLAIHSYHQDYPWTESQYNAYKTQLIKLLPEYSINFSTEYLDTKRITPSSTYRHFFLDYISKKYNKNKPDLIYVTDDNALSFILSGHQKPSWKVPVVFSGINNTGFGKGEYKGIVAGVFEIKDIQASIDMANTIEEKDSRIIFLGDGGVTDVAIKEVIRNSVSEKNSLEVVYLSDATLSLLLDKLNTIGKGIVVITTIGRVHDADGNLLELKSIFKALTDTGRKILVMEDSYLFPGVLGGYVTSARIQGESAADVSEHIIRGGIAGNIKDNISELVLSWPEAVRFGVDIKKSVFNRAKLINLPAPLIEQYPELIRWLLWFVIVLVLALVAFIFNVRNKGRLLQEQYTDLVTGLPNRVKLRTDINSAGSPCLSIIDINNFKLINNLYGLNVGDALLKMLGEKLRHYVSNNYLVYRVGGNQFAILNKDKSSSPSFYLNIKNLLRDIQNNSYRIDELDINLTLTAGICRNEREFLIPRTEQALQQAKENNKDYVVFEKHEQDTATYRDNIIWAKKLSEALTEKRILPYFQPIVHNKSGERNKYEALARLIDEDGTIVPPFFFLETAKTTRQYAMLTKIMIEKALKAVEHVDISVSINLSVDDVRDEKTISFFKSKLKEYQVADKVIVELTESEGIENYAEVSEFILEIKKLGCRIAIDDFGTGYSNFTHLIHLNVDYLKIDGSIIQNILKDKNAEIVTKTIVQFASQLGIETVAEFVDSKEIKNKVTELGVDYSQGYYLGKSAIHFLD